MDSRIHQEKLAARMKISLEIQVSHLREMARTAQETASRRKVAREVREMASRPRETVRTAQAMASRRREAQVVQVTDRAGLEVREAACSPHRSLTTQ